MTKYAYVCNYYIFLLKYVSLFHSERRKFSRNNSERINLHQFFVPFILARTRSAGKIGKLKQSARLLFLVLKRTLYFSRENQGRIDRERLAFPFVLRERPSC